MNRDQTRINQLTSPYSPFNPPQLSLDFSDLLSLIWRIDRHAGQKHLAQYYMECTRSLSRAFRFEQRSLGRVIRTTEPGRMYEMLGNVPFRETHRLSDASARRAAIQQLAQLRADVLSIGVYQHNWIVGWPGSGVQDLELRERIFATLFTALPSQYSHFGRLILVIDIVLQELLLGNRESSEFTLGTLIDRFGYPDPEDQRVRDLYSGELKDWAT
jgi:hypothetical protein